MRCEEVRYLLPELVDSVPEGAVAEHLAGCEACSAQLREYRTIASALSSLRYEVAEPSAGFVDRVLTTVPHHERLRLIHRMVSDERVHRAAFSLGGAVVGGAAIGLLWWRAARRPLSAAGTR